MSQRRTAPAPPAPAGLIGLSHGGSRNPPPRLSDDVAADAGPEHNAHRPIVVLTHCAFRVLQLATVWGLSMVLYANSDEPRSAAAPKPLTVAGFSFTLAVWGVVVSAYVSWRSTRSLPDPVTADSPPNHLAALRGSTRRKVWRPTPRPTIAVVATLVVFLVEPAIRLLVVALALGCFARVGTCAALSTRRRHAVMVAIALRRQVRWAATFTLREPPMTVAESLRLNPRPDERARLLSAMATFAWYADDMALCEEAATGSCAARPTGRRHSILDSSPLGAVESMRVAPGSSRPKR